MKALKLLRRQLCELQVRADLGDRNLGPYTFRATDDMLSWTCTLMGPIGTPYTGGRFEVMLQFPNSYPKDPPTVEFVTPIYHCNVGTTGLVCLNMLQSSWQPGYDVLAIMVALTWLLHNPNPDSPVNAVAGRLFTKHRERYDSNARYYTNRYASSNGQGSDNET